MADVPVLAAGHADAQILVPLQFSSELLAQQPPMINVLGGFLEDEDGMGPYHQKIRSRHHSPFLLLLFSLPRRAW
jgi:hypothetical protein